MVLARTTAAACALAVAAALGVSACGEPSEEAGIEEPAREGLAIPIGGVEYQVFITRQLNLEVVPDNAYYQGPQPGKEDALYAVFLEACNHGKQEVRTSDSFKVVDNQDNEFEPIEIESENQFSYQPRTLGPDECIPEVGSIAQQGPTGGAMLVFELPITTTENRPLELEITSPASDEHPEPETRKIELDL
jgi:hypothetical protein